jgi:hypothetical protein
VLLSDHGCGPSSGESIYKGLQTECNAHSSTVELGQPPACEFQQLPTVCVFGLLQPNLPPAMLAATKVSVGGAHFVVAVASFIGTCLPAALCEIVARGECHEVNHPHIN